MKKLLLLLTLLTTTLFIKAQTAPADTTYWERGGFVQLTFSQVSLTNWAAGGENSISGLFTGNLFANYAKGKHSWQNALNLGYGLIYTDRTKKNDDKIDLSSIYGYKVADKWYLSSLLNFKTQFTEGFKYSDTEAEDVNISNFMAPGYLSLGIGMDYKPNDDFSIYLSPATGKFTFVMNDSIDETRYGLDAGETIRTEFGAAMRAELNRDLAENITLWTKLELFNNYTDPVKENRANIDIDWQVRIDLKVNSWLSANIFTHLIYDHDIKFDIDTDEDGEVDYTAPRTQFKEVFGLGVSYKFDNKPNN